MSLRVSEFVEVASGLGYPEGPVAMADGGVAAVDVKNGNLVRYCPDPNHPGHYVAAAPVSLRDPKSGLGCGPNGAAIGPDGYLYVCNNGGMQFMPVPLQKDGKSWVLNVPGEQSSDYAGGYIQRVSLSGGAFETWCAPNSPAPPVTLRSPDDLVFDSAGGLWFTDWGKTHGGVRDITGVFYLPRGSQTPILKIPNRGAPNGIQLSPNGDRLYVAETYARWIMYWEIGDPGNIRMNPETLDGSYLLTASIPGQGTLDSMGMDEEGNLYAATMLPDGLAAMSNGGITVVSPKGEIIEFIRFDIGLPEPLPSNICFGGPDRKTAFITLGGTGRIVTCRMAIPGLKPAFGS
jgi:gluconolactonase